VAATPPATGAAEDPAFRDQRVPDDRRTADEWSVTISGTTADRTTGAEETAATAALAAGLDAVAQLYDDAMDLIAHLAETWDSPEEVRVVRLAERPTVSQRVEAAA
jgi:hypothetical protein